jgi:hypothetical protein
MSWFSYGLSRASHKVTFEEWKVAVVITPKHVVDFCLEEFPPPVVCKAAFFKNSIIPPVLG